MSAVFTTETFDPVMNLQKIVSMAFRGIDLTKSWTDTGASEMTLEIRLPSKVFPTVIATVFSSVVRIMFFHVLAAVRPSGEHIATHGTPILDIPWRHRPSGASEPV